MTHHFCDSPTDPTEADPDEWTCPRCGRVWELRIQDGIVDGEAFYDSWYQPRERCEDCERCRWDPQRDCGKPDHPHCPTCGHCQGRHAPVPKEVPDKPRVVITVYPRVDDSASSDWWLRQRR